MMLSSDNIQILGIDIGGSGIKGAPVNVDNGQLTQERFRISTPCPPKPRAVISVISEILQHYKWTGPVGCGFPGVIKKGKILTAANLHSDWIGVEFPSLFKPSLRDKVHVLNDADAAALAEMTFGLGKKYKGVVIFVTVGTGIGTAIFNEGCLLPNSEFGHLIMNGKIAEHYASDAARKKEDLSWKKWGIRFSAYLAELERLFWPELIIIGGGISKKFEKYRYYLKTNVKVLPAQLRNEAGIIGAATAVMRNL